MKTFTAQRMKLIAAFTLVQILIVLALSLVWPSHSSEQEPAPADAIERSVPVGAVADDTPFVSDSSRMIQDRGSKPGAFAVSARSGDRSAALGSSSADGQSTMSVHRGQTAYRTKRLRPRGKRTDASSAPLPIPTAQEAEQILAIPLAFFATSPEANLTDDQAANLETIASQFNATLAATGKEPSDPAYAEIYRNALRLADEQVWATQGQGAYMALINERSQAAGNFSPGQ